MATTKFIESGGDATGDFSFWNQGSGDGTLSIDTTVAKDGSNSIKCVLASSSTNSGAQVYTNDGIISDAGALMSCWMRFSTVSPATNGAILCASQSGNGSVIIAVGITTTGVLTICGRGCTEVDGSTVLSANIWYRITLTYKITSSTNWSAKLYINGVLEASTSNTQGTLGKVTTSDAVFGLDTTGAVDSFGTTPAMTVWIDSVYIDNRTDNSDCGNVHVTAKRPNANGTTNGFTTQIGSGGSGYGTGHSPQVNERPLNTANGWSVIGAGSAITEEYNIESSATGDVDISAATIVDYMGWLYTKALAAETGKIIVNNVQTNISITTSNALFTQIAGSTTYPAGTGTDIGEITSTTLTTVSLYEAGIVVAYIPAVVSTFKPKLLTLLGVG